jgi:23S rRNA (adenine2503-C2)-methyltransferase
MKKKPNLYNLTLEELQALYASWNEPPYRANQTWEWLYQHMVTEPEQMTSLSKSLRVRLTAETTVDMPRILAQQESMDGETRKDLLEFSDGATVEVVLMRYIDRRSACLSTQVGCAVGCRFCATGQMGFKRQLRSGEIVTQALHLQRELMSQGQTLTNIVLMGMGEPMLNYDNTLSAIRCMIHPKGMGIGQRRITLSTAGIAPGITRFAREDLQVNLAVSLHAATDDLRSQLMPVNRRYDLNALFSVIQKYIDRTNRRVTFEWVLIEQVNDTEEQALALAARLSGMLAHVNLIPLNPTTGFDGRPSSPERIEAFTHILDRKHIPYSLRLSRGNDIRAGCGQLRENQEP